MNNDIITDDKQNYLSEPDENNKPRINPTYYKNTITELINRYISESQTNPYTPTLDPDKLTNNNMIAINNYINKALFTNPEQRYISDRKCNIPYTEFNINTLFTLYIDITTSFNCIPSMFGFSCLTGLDELTIKRYLTPASCEMINIRREMLRNLLADDKTGRIVLANNDSSFGLEYERKNTVERETIRRGLSLGDLPKLE